MTESGYPSMLIFCFPCGRQSWLFVSCLAYVHFRLMSYHAGWYVWSGQDLAKFCDHVTPNLPYLFYYFSL